MQCFNIILMFRKIIVDLIFAVQGCVIMMIAMATLACTLAVYPPELDRVILNAYSVDMEGNMISN